MKKESKRLFLTISISIFILISGAKAQKTDTLPPPVALFHFNKAAHAIAADEQSNVYLLTREGCYKYFQFTQYDSVASTSGERALVFPREIRVSNHAKIYILDGVTRKIHLLNTNLRQLRDYEAGPNVTPESFDVAPGGEIFILDERNNDVIKLDIWGRKESSFELKGDANARFSDPVQLIVPQDNFQEPDVYVLDDGNVKVLDASGAFETTLTIDCTRISVWESVLYGIKDDVLYLIASDYRLQFRLPFKAKDITVRAEGAYLLSEKTVYFYPRKDFEKR